MWKENLPKLIKVGVLVMVIGLLIGSMVYLNQRWGRIRDIRRLADAKTVVKAIQFYYNQFEELPETSDDDGQGWDKSNDPADRRFLESLMAAGILQNQPFDPKNDSSYYYRYQKFPAGSFGCPRAFSIFQVMKYETEGLGVGAGDCQDWDFIESAPDGYTWQDFE